MKTKTLIYLSGYLKRNRCLPRRKLYPQTWYCMPRSRILRKIIQYICGVFGGHELSKTEWGYGGGKYADRNCRWCDKVIKVPKESLYFQFENSKDFILTFKFKDVARKTTSKKRGKDDK